MKNLFGPAINFNQMNDKAAQAPSGSYGVRILPFGNGAERMLNNKSVGVHLHNIDLNLHERAHIFRAAQEGIACAFRYGLDIMRENGMNPSVIRAGKANLFLSPLFAEIFVNATGVPVELYKNDGSVGAALGAGIGSKTFSSASEAFSQMEKIKVIEPTGNKFEPIYQDWKKLLEIQLKKTN
jgi:xylulokinase